MVQDSEVHGGGNTGRAKEAGLGWEYSPSEGRVGAAQEEAGQAEEDARV